jgi:aspartate-semialdehyde dehydrogenase
MDKDKIKELEAAYAAANIPVVSNASANRWTDDVPMLIPEINPDHTDIIAAQKKHHGWDKGFVAVKPNCSLQSYMAPIFALQQAGYPIKKMIVTTMQAVSGAGYPGVSSFDMIDNIVPYIGGEEEKTEKECLKILGSVKDGKIENAPAPLVAAHCNRVAVIDGHTACVSLEFDLPEDKKPSLEEIEKVWTSFRGVPQELDLPSAPVQPIHVRHENNRPQPRRDRETDKGMAVTIGRLRECPVFDVRFVALSHNTKRGAAMGGITLFLPGGPIGFIAGMAIGIYIGEVCGNVLDEVFGKGAYEQILHACGYVAGTAKNLGDMLEKYRENIRKIDANKEKIKVTRTDTNKKLNSAESYLALAGKMLEEI